MNFDYPKEIGELSAEQRLTFYETFAHNLTISLRSVWSDDELTDAEKVDRMKWINEIMHRITAKISITRQNEHEWTEQDLWEMIKDYAAQNPGIRGEVGNAILHSYSHVISGGWIESLTIDWCMSDRLKPATINGGI
jgi:hypothetical protein